jgi:CheY-like chemotaxis protein
VNREECILVVDDSRSIIRIVKLVLERHGYRVVTAHDGFEALKVAFREEPDVILLDVMMPGLDGYEVCRRLQDRPETRAASVIFLTVKGRLDLPDLPGIEKTMDQNIEDRAKGFETGAIGFISKPVSAKEVLDEIERVLALKRLGI